MGSMRTKTVGIRRLWAAYLALYAVLFVVGAYSYLTMSELPLSFLVSKMAVELFMIYGLFGFVVRRPIRSVTLRVAFIIAAAILCGRAVLVLYVASPIFFPWHSDAGSFFSLTLTVLLQLLAAFALGRYATTWQDP
jgi:hypothetical protein